MNPPLVLNLVRQFNAPRQAVFDAFTTYESMSRWFGPESCRVVGGSADFRVGGALRIFMETPQGESVIDARYTVIQPPAKLCFTWKWENDEDWEGIESLVEIEFHEIINGTELHFRHTGFPSAESRDNHAAGWQGTLDNLEREV